MSLGHSLWRSRWKHARREVWRCSGDVALLEARAVVLSLHRLARTRQCGNVRQLFLSDNLPVALAFERCQSGHFGVSIQTHRFQSYCLELGTARFPLS